MANKHSSAQRRAPAPPEVPQARQAKILLALTLVPLLVGLAFILAALAGFIFWNSRAAQAALGGVIILVSFAASNALQKQWLLAAGWLLLGVGIGLGFGFSASWPVAAAFLLGGSGLYLLLSEFLKRGWAKSRSRR